MYYARVLTESHIIPLCIRIPGLKSRILQRQYINIRHWITHLYIDPVSTWQVMNNNLPVKVCLPGRSFPESLPAV